MTDILRLRPWNEHDVLDIPTLKARVVASANLLLSLPNHAHGHGPLGVAAYHGNVEACRILLEAGADANRGPAPLVLAIEGRYSTVQMVKQRMFSAEVMSDVLRTLVAHGADVNGRDPGYFPSSQLARHDESPMFVAIFRGDAAAARELIALGADIELAADRFSITLGLNNYTGPVKPLQYASDLGRHSMVADLIRAGADNACLANSVDGANALQVCVRRDHKEAVEYFIRERGEDLGQRVPWGNRTLIQWAKTPEMRALINSLKIELMAKDALGDHVTSHSKRSSPSPL